MGELKEIGNTSYKVFSGRINFKRIIRYLNDNHITYSRFFILVDDNTEEYCLPDFIEDHRDYILIRMPSGEEFKTIDTSIRIWQQLIDCEADRYAILINLGGGVVCDLGGFVASCYKRGIKYINVPTTLLAQVDASVGAKTGIDFGGVKNGIGTFYKPLAVFVSDSYFNTLPPDEIRSGYAEVIKHAMLDSREKVLQSFICFKAQHIKNELIEDNITYKLGIVSIDPYEKAERKYLNWGHTVGHAVESLFLMRNTPILHGNAVAFGILVELYLSVKLLNFSKEDLNLYQEFYCEFYNHLFQIDREDIDLVLMLMRNDKKNQSQQLNFTLLSRFGEPKINQYVPEEIVSETMFEVLQFLP
jgi:3-dehydroquinate synthase